MPEVLGSTAGQFVMCQSKRKLNFYIRVDEDGRMPRKTLTQGILPFLYHISYILFQNSVYLFSVILYPPGFLESQHFLPTCYPVSHQMTL